MFAMDWALIAGSTPTVAKCGSKDVDPTLSTVPS